MPRFLLPAFLLGTLLSAATVAPALAQSDSRTGAAAIDPWATTSVATDTPQYPTGWSTAPGMSLGVNQRPTTDYNGRPLKQQPRVKRVATDDLALVDVADDPMMRSSGVMIAPGMNTAPYRRVSSDYNGRPLRKSTHISSSIGARVSKAAPVATVPSTSW